MAAGSAADIGHDELMPDFFLAVACFGKQLRRLAEGIQGRITLTVLQMLITLTGKLFGFFGGVVQCHGFSLRRFRADLSVRTEGEGKTITFIMPYT
jgi:hypothetical protein